MMVSPVFVLLDLISWEVFLIGVAIKFFSDYNVMRKGFKKFDLKFHPVRFIVLFVIHPLEIVLSAAGGHLLPFNWKGESFRSKLKNK